jgi:hypothetical protein
MKPILKIWNVFVKWLISLIISKKETVFLSKEKVEEKPENQYPKFTRKFTILNKQPESMSFEAYKTHLKKQKKHIKNRKKGFLVYLSSTIINTELENKYRKKEKIQHIQKYRSFVGSVRYDLTKPI